MSRELALGADLLRRLEALAVRVGRRRAAGAPAGRSGALRGGRAEFLDHRAYAEGDDLRDLDWPLYARTGETFVKVFGVERAKRVRILLDLSPSMAEPETKELFACRLAAALAHAALAAGDAVEVFAASSPEAIGPLRGARSTPTLAAWLGRLPIGGPADWEALARRLRAAPAPPGALLVLSDFWTGDAPVALHAFARAGTEIALLQTLSAEELHPSLRGELRLVDAETGEEASLRPTGEDLAAVREATGRRIAALADRAARRGMRHLLCRTDLPFETVVLDLLRRGGVLG